MILLMPRDVTISKLVPVMVIYLTQDMVIWLYFNQTLIESKILHFKMFEGG